ncbi:MAG: exodeoxyribonuclease VII large subunit [Acidimicrobiales bacterium]
MVPDGVPEEQRFDFAPGGAPAEDTGAELKRRMDDVLAAAQRAEQRRVATGAPSRAPRRRAPGAGRARPDEAGADDSAGPSAPVVDEALSVTEFYERVKAALAREFTEDVWVVGEIRGLRESRGHHYVELADESGEQADRPGVAQLEVVCWARDWPRIAAALDAAGVALEPGRVVRVRGRVSIWEGGSKLRFTLTELDIEAMLGGIAAARRRLLGTLEAEGLLHANQRLELSLVPLRVGVVTSPGSEAHRDFVGQLDRSGFAFRVHFEPTLVQGAEAPEQIAAALGRLASFPIDLAVVVRGGGARGDLAAFDAEVVARAIATARFPVWTGIGHTSDRSVADEVAHRALITPTQCGEAVVARVAEYLGEIERKGGALTGLARARLDSAAFALAAGAAGLRRIARHQFERRSIELGAAGLALTRVVTARLRREVGELSGRAGLLGSVTRRSFASHQHELARRQQVLRAFDPQRQLERGWTLTGDASGRPVRSAAALAPGGRITTRFADGEALSVVESTRAGDAGPQRTMRTDGGTP